MCRNATLAIVLLAGTSLAACSGDKAGAGGCAGAGECQAGEICLDEACAQLCSSDLDCDDSGAICDGDICTQGARTNAPVITSVDGDGTFDGLPGHTARHVESSVTIVGEHFEGAQVTLSDGSRSWELALCSVTPEVIQALLPSGITAGSYQLTVANQAGSCDQTLPVLQGEKGDKGDKGDPGDAGVPCLGCVDQASLAAGAVTAAAIGAGEVGTSELAADAVDSSRVLDGSLTGADLDSSTSITAASITAADFAYSDPVARTLWLSAAHFATSKNDWAAMELYRTITLTERMVFGIADADTVLENSFSATYNAANHGWMALHSHNAEDITAAHEFVLPAGDRITGIDCYFFDNSADSRVQTWIEKQPLLDEGVPTLVGRVLHSGLGAQSGAWQKKSQSLDETVVADTLYRVRLELNVQGDGDSENIGARGCTIHYETTRL